MTRIDEIDSRELRIAPAKTWQTRQRLDRLMPNPCYPFNPWFSSDFQGIGRLIRGKRIG